MTTEEITEFKTVEETATRLVCDQCGGHAAETIGSNLQAVDAGWGVYDYRGSRGELAEAERATYSAIAASDLRDKYEEAEVHFCPDCDAAFQEMGGWNEGETVRAYTRGVIETIRVSGYATHLAAAGVAMFFAVGAILPVGIAVWGFDAVVPETVVVKLWAALATILFATLELAYSAGFHDGKFD